MRLIDADALMQSLGITNMDCDKCAWYDKEWSRCKRGGDFEDACCAIDDAPTIEQRKTGKWIVYKSGWLCSECSEFVMSAIMGYPRYNFCPMCGAKMEAET